MATTTYTYNPAEICKPDKDRMRFELGDTNVDGEAATAFLSDQEINAMIVQYSDSWKKAKLALVNAVCMKLSFEVDWRNDGTSINLNQRADRWLKLRDQLEKEVAQSSAVPLSVLHRLTREPDRGHYFYEGMLGNPAGAPPPDEAYLDRA